MDFANDWEIDPENHPEKTYEQGIADGRQDCIFIQRPVNTGGYTLEAYCRIRDKLNTCVYNFAPTEYQRGYADGFDQIAEQILEACPEY